MGGDVGVVARDDGVEEEERALHGLVGGRRGEEGRQRGAHRVLQHDDVHSAAQQLRGEGEGGLAQRLHRIHDRVQLQTRCTVALQRAREGLVVHAEQRAQHEGDGGGEACRVDGALLGLKALDIAVELRQQLRQHRVQQAREGVAEGERVHVALEVRPQRLRVDAVQQAEHHVQQREVVRLGVRLGNGVGLHDGVEDDDEVGAGLAEQGQQRQHLDHFLLDQRQLHAARVDAQNRQEIGQHGDLLVGLDHHALHGEAVRRRQVLQLCVQQAHRVVHQVAALLVLELLADRALLPRSRQRRRRHRRRHGGARVVQKVIDVQIQVQIQVQTLFRLLRLHWLLACLHGFGRRRDADLLWLLFLSCFLLLHRTLLFLHHNLLLLHRTLLLLHYRLLLLRRRLCRGTVLAVLLEVAGLQQPDQLQVLADGLLRHVRQEAPAELHALHALELVQPREERLVALRQVRQQQRRRVARAQPAALAPVVRDQVLRPPRLQQHVLRLRQRRHHGQQVVGTLRLLQQHQVRRPQRALRHVRRARQQRRLLEERGPRPQLLAAVVSPHVHLATAQQRCAAAARRVYAAHLALLARQHAHEARLPEALDLPAEVHLALRAQQHRVRRARRRLRHLELHGQPHQRRRVLRRLEAQLALRVVAAAEPTPHATTPHAHVAVRAHQHREPVARAARRHLRQARQKRRRRHHTAVRALRRAARRVRR